MDDDVRDLIGQLDEPAVVSEEAAAELMARGPGVVPILVASLDGLGRLGSLFAVELLSELGGAEAGPALVTLLDHEDFTVGEWAARALGALGHRPACPALRALQRRLVEARADPAWSESACVRAALRDLGCRPVVAPGVPGELPVGAWGRNTWPVAVATDVVDALATRDQVVLDVATVRAIPGGWTYVPHDRLGWQFDYAASWESNVREGRDAALLEIAFLPVAGDLAVKFEWIDQSDITGPFGD